MKGFKFFVIAVILAALAVTAQGFAYTFTVDAIHDLNFGNHHRLYVTMGIAEYYPYGGQAAIRVYFAKGHAIGNELPQFDNMALYVPTAGYYWDRSFWIAKPDGLTGEWNLRVDIEDSYQQVIASSNEFAWDFGGDDPVAPADFTADLDWVVDDVGMGWSTFIVITNAGAAAAEFTLDSYYAGTGGANAALTRELPPRAAWIIDTNTSAELQNRYLNARIRSAQPFTALVYCYRLDTADTFQYRVEGKQ